MNTSKPDMTALLCLLCDIDFEALMREIDSRDSRIRDPKPKITFGRLESLKRNISDIIEILFIEGKAYLSKIDGGLRDIYAKEDNADFYIELGGGSIGVSRMLDYLAKIGILEEKVYPYRLKRKYQEFLAS